MIKCLFCNQLFHSGKDTPWTVNKPFIKSTGIDVDLSSVREAQSAMRMMAVPSTTRRNSNVPQRSSQDEDETSPVEDVAVSRRSQRLIAREEEVAVHNNNEIAGASDDDDNGEVHPQLPARKRTRITDNDVATSTMTSSDGSSSFPSTESSSSESTSDETFDFTEQAFMNNSLFHVNPFINAKKKKHVGFRPFIKEGIATVGMAKVHSSVAKSVDTLTYEQIRDTLRQEKGWDTSSNGFSDGKQAPMWLKNARVGSFVIMRHQYPACKYCPKRLFDNGGKYIGSVYAIGVIKKKVPPESSEEQRIASNLIKTSSCPPKYLYNFCLVDWKRMGMKNNLSSGTQKYLNATCQSTFACICNEPGKRFSNGATSESIRQDLWENANISICSDEFSDNFKC